MHRRNFLACTTTAAVSGAALRFAARPAGASEPRSNGKKFTLHYAPHFGLFGQLGGKDPIDQLKFAADEGFTAWEDNRMKSRPIELQKQIARTIEKLGMRMGVISALAGVWGTVNFAGGDEAAREEVLVSMRQIVDVAKRVNAKWLTVVPGLENPKLPHGYQMASCIELLRKCCDIVGPHGLVMVLEPLNRIKNHPGVFLHGSPQAFEICRAVNHPSCKILFDIYHQQITEGNLIPNIDHCWDEIAYFQTGDTPGRHEPGTGEINFRNVLAHIHEKGYAGVIGMEHDASRPGADGERAVIEAYRRVDPV